VSIRVLPSVVFCFTLKIYRKGAPFYNAWEIPRPLRDFPSAGGNGGKVPGLDFSTVSTARHFPQGICPAHLAGHSEGPFPLPRLRP
jgi:hypothetical protein